MRRWIKVRLQDNPDAHYAADVVERWRSMRGAALHVARAIQIYYGLLNGDTTTLRKYFPFLMDSMQPRQLVDSPAPAPVSTEPKTRVKRKTAAQDEDDFFDSLGLE
jgi:uncharacterized damage-inducible protein DinB